MFHGNCFDIMADDELIPMGSVNLVLCDPLRVRLAKNTMSRRVLLRVLLVALMSLNVEGASIDAGSMHSCALLTYGKVVCWGYNERGELGDGTTSDSTTPVEVSGITTATSLAVGSAHSCALLVNATVMCWGKNSEGELGDESVEEDYLSGVAIPVKVSGITNATSIALGSAHSCALLTDGTMRCWGSNYRGQLGDGTTTDSTTPVEVSGLPLYLSPPPPSPPPNATGVPPPPSPPPQKSLVLVDYESSALGYSVLTAVVLSILVWIGA